MTDDFILGLFNRTLFPTHQTYTVQETWAKAAREVMRNPAVRQCAATANRLVGGHPVRVRAEQPAGEHHGRARRGAWRLSAGERTRRPAARGKPVTEDLSNCDGKVGLRCNVNGWNGGYSVRERSRSRGRGKRGVTRTRGLVTCLGATGWSLRWRRL